MNLEEIRNLVSKVLRTHIAPSILKEVRVYQETDSDGEQVLRFQVIIERDGPDLDAEKVFFATGVVRDALDRVAETRFPLLTFPSSDEIPGVAA